MRIAREIVEFISIDLAAHDPAQMVGARSFDSSNDGSDDDVLKIYTSAGKDHEAFVT